MGDSGAAVVLLGLGRDVSLHKPQDCGVLSSWHILVLLNQRRCVLHFYTTLRPCQPYYFITFFFKANSQLH